MVASPKTGVKLESVRREAFRHGMMDEPRVCRSIVDNSPFFGLYLQSKSMGSALVSGVAHSTHHSY